MLSQNCKSSSTHTSRDHFQKHEKAYIMKIPYIRPIPAGISYAAGFSDICRDYRSLKYLLTTLLFGPF